MSIKKFGNGNTKYTIKFKYIQTNITSIKNVYADSEEEALKLFNEMYKDYKIEIKELKRKLGGLNNE